MQNQQVGNIFKNIGKAVKKAAKGVGKVTKKVVHRVDKIATGVAHNPAFMVALPGVSLGVHTLSRATGGKGVVHGKLGRLIDAGTGAVTAAVPAGRLTAGASVAMRPAARLIKPVLTTANAFRPALTAARKAVPIKTSKATAAVKLAVKSAARTPPKPAAVKPPAPMSPLKHSPLKLAPFAGALKIAQRNAAIKPVQLAPKAGSFVLKPSSAMRPKAVATAPVRATPAAPRAGAAREGLFVGKDGTIDFSQTHWAPVAVGK